MRKISILLFLMLSIPNVYSQDNTLFRVDTLRIMQSWKKFLTNNPDTSYISIKIPNTEIVPDVDLNYDQAVIHCNDGVVITLNQTPIIPERIRPIVLEKYPTAGNEFGNEFLHALQNEFIRIELYGESGDSSLINPAKIVYEGTDNQGLWWKIVRLGYISYSYENVQTHQKQYYDSVIDEWEFVPNNNIRGYITLPLYKLR